MPLSFRLGEEHEALLARLSQESGISQSEIVRRALVLYAEQRAATDAVTATYVAETVREPVACRDCGALIRDGWRPYNGDRRGALVCSLCME